MEHLRRLTFKKKNLLRIQWISKTCRFFYYIICQNVNFSNKIHEGRAYLKATLQESLREPENLLKYERIDNSFHDKITKANSEFESLFDC